MRISDGATISSIAHSEAAFDDSMEKSHYFLILLIDFRLFITTLYRCECVYVPVQSDFDFVWSLLFISTSHGAVAALVREMDLNVQ